MNNIELFLDSVVALSQTESQYSSTARMEEMYIFSKDFVLILNVGVRSGLSRVKAFEDIFCICSDQVHVFNTVIPTGAYGCPSLLFMSNGACCGGSYLQENIIDNVFFPCIKSNKPCVCPSADGIQVYVKMIGRTIWRINNDV